MAVIDRQVNHLTRLVDELLDVRASPGAKSACNASGSSSAS